MTDPRKRPEALLRFYLDPSGKRLIFPPDISDSEAVLHLRGNNWDDYTYNTLFNATLFLLGKHFGLGPIRLLIEGFKSTRDGLKDYDGYKFATFLRKEPRLFLSLGGDLDYYRTLTTLLGKELRDHLLRMLHDAAYLQVESPENPSLVLRESEGFEKSLLRSLSERQAFEEASQVLFGGARKENRSFSVGYSLRGVPGRQSLYFDFAKADRYPGNINLLIGSNGTGKTQALKAIVSAFIDRHFLLNKELANLDDLAADTSSTNAFSQIVAVSYSPFEDFPTASSRKPSGGDQYQYCGFRTDRSVSGETILEEGPAALRALVSLDTDSVPKGQPSRASTFISAMRSAVDFDALWLQDPASEEPRLIWDTHVNETIKPFRATSTDRLAFGRGPDILKLSAGQTIFVALLLSILRYMKKDALLLVDEPELYLHPNLEVKFITMLRTLLQELNAYAVISTHSMIMAREIPRQRMWVLRRTTDGVIDRARPPFQTFGADLTRLGNYVFDDAFVPHPYLEWLKSRLRDGQDVEEIIDDDMSIELKLLLRSVQRGSALPNS